MICPRVFLAAVSLALLSVALPAGAQQPPPPGVSQPRTFLVSGAVRLAENNQPLDQVKVELLTVSGQPITVVFTQSTGDFSIEGLRTGSYVLLVEVDGFQPHRQEVEIFGNRVGLQIFLRRADAFTGQEPGGTVSARELAIPAKAREAYRKGLARFYEKKDPAGGLKHFQQAVAELPAFYEAHFEMGIVYREMGRPEDAEQAFRRSLQSSGEKYAEAFFGLASLSTAARRYPEAVAHARRGLELEPQSWQGSYELARALKELGRLEEAEAAARAARERNPRFADVHLLLANIHMALQDLPALLEDLDGYLRVAPDGPMSVQVRRMREAVRQELARAPGRPAANVPRP